MNTRTAKLNSPLSEGNVSGRESPFYSGIIYSYQSLAQMNVFMGQPSTDVRQAPSLQDFPYYYVQELQMGSMHNIAQIYLSLDCFFLGVDCETLFGELQFRKFQTKELLYLIRSHCMASFSSKTELHINYLMTQNSCKPRIELFFLVSFLYYAFSMMKQLSLPVFPDTAEEIDSAT